MILHIDGDAFFASCEVSLHKEYRGKPLVVGGEKGIVTALTYEAKARGLSRGLPMHIVRQICPEVIVVSGDYRSYGIFSARMVAIVRRYADVVEEYSIDECFADLGGLRKSEEETLALLDSLRNALRKELGLTFSLGVAPTKVLAKIASKHRKPFGLTILPEDKIGEFIKDLPIGKVWGIGRATAESLRPKGFQTVGQFAALSESYVDATFSKPLRWIWRELRGESLSRVRNGSREEHKSIAKTRTFCSPTSDPALLYSELSKNVERACYKARKYGLAAGEISFFLKTTEFRYHTAEVKLPQRTAAPEEILRAVQKNFPQIFLKGLRYRSSGITLRSLRSFTSLQGDLFGEGRELRALERVHRTADGLSKKFGRSAIFLASSFAARMRAPQRSKKKSAVGQRAGQQDFRRLPILYWGEAS